MTGARTGTPGKPTIVWDVDDVLNDLMRRWLEDGWRAARPSCTTTWEQISENPPHRLLGTSLDTYLDSLDEYRLRTAAGLEPDPQVLEWFERHGAAYRHIALTAVPLSAAHVSAGWVMRHFGRWVRAFAVAPSVRPESGAAPGEMSKADVVSWLGGAELFIDDNPTHVAAARAAGATAVLVPRPWNGAPGTTASALEALTDAARAAATSHSARAT